MDDPNEPSEYALRHLSAADLRPTRHHAVIVFLRLLVNRSRAIHQLCTSNYIFNGFPINRLCLPFEATYSVLSFWKPDSKRLGSLSKSFCYFTPHLPSPNNFSAKLLQVVVQEDIQEFLLVH
jgi:hypothetical protein